MPPSAMYEPAACPWCGCNEPAERYAELHVVDCPRCELCYASPQLNGAARHDLYSQEYFQSADSQALGYDDYESDRQQLLHTFSQRIAALPRPAGRRGRLLDVGCATGISVQAARDAGWEAEGIDISEYAVARGVAQHDLPLHGAEITTWQSPLAPYDAITMWDYIEHVPNPLQSLHAAHRLLRPGGRLVLTTPDVASWPARWYGARWMGYKRDEHLVYFSPVHLRVFLRATGFQPLFHHHVGKHVSLAFFCSRLEMYAPRLGRTLAALLGLVHLDRVVLYVNPMDIMCVTAERSADPSV